MERIDIILKQWKIYIKISKHEFYDGEKNKLCSKGNEWAGDIKSQAN